MAGDWIKVEMTTPDKPEVVRMSQALGIDQDSVVGKLLRVWIWADQNTVCGNDAGVTSLFLDRITYCQGFADAMANVGWLIECDGVFRFPNFDRHNGKTAKERAVTNRRVGKHRANSNADVTLTQLHKPLPEKRREEEKQRPPLAIASAEIPDIDPKAALWREWKKVSGDTGALLGKLCKEHGDGAVLTAVATVLNERPADPKSFIVRILSPNPGKAGRVDGYGYVLDKHGKRTGERGAVV